MEQMPYILIAEDDSAIATGLAMNLKLEGYRSEVVGDGEKAWQSIQSASPDLVLLDIGLPIKDGLELLADMRDSNCQVPVIVVSARFSESDKVLALRLGADDYVTKPFALAELMARIDAVLRRSMNTRDVTSSNSFADVQVEREARRVTRQGKEVALTHLEFKLLAYFLDHPDEVIERDQLLREVWGTSGSRRTVDNFVGQLRSKLEDDPESPKHFRTVRGAGYRFVP